MNVWNANHRGAAEFLRATLNQGQVFERTHLMINGPGLDQSSVDSFFFAKQIEQPHKGTAAILPLLGTFETYHDV